jgi:hypothetical protein
MPKSMINPVLHFMFTLIFTGCMGSYIEYGELGRTQSPGESVRKIIFEALPQEVKANTPFTIILRFIDKGNRVPSTKKVFLTVENPLASLAGITTMDLSNNTATLNDLSIAKPGTWRLVATLDTGEFAISDSIQVTDDDEQQPPVDPPPPVFGWLPTGGSVGQVLSKSANTHFATTWIDYILEPTRFDTHTDLGITSHKTLQIIYENAMKMPENPLSIVDTNVKTSSDHTWQLYAAFSGGNELSGHYLPEGYINLSNQNPAETNAATSPYAVIDATFSGAVWYQALARAPTHSDWRQKHILKFVSPGNLYGVDIGQGSIRVVKAESGVETVITELGSSAASNPAYYDSHSIYELKIIVRRCHTNYAPTGRLLEIHLNQDLLGFSPISSEDWTTFFATEQRMGIMIGHENFELYSFAAGPME